jgi:branched-chain amino acid transport system substrate-binding protein
MTRKTLTALLGSAALVATTPALAEDGPIIIGFAVAESGFMQAYDEPATQAAMIRIEEINEEGGLLGRQIEAVFADTRSDRAEGARAGLEVLEAGADLVVVSCDYDFGAPAALMAEAQQTISFFLCAESIRAGIQGVGPHSFSASVLAPVQGATMAEWAYQELGARTFYVLEDTWTEYNKGICDGFDWRAPQIEGLEIVGRDTFVNDDASIAAQITRIRNLPEPPDAIMLCSMMPGVVSAVRQIRNAGIDVPILNGSGVDGSYWMDAVPGLSEFYIPVQGSIYGDDPDPEVEAFNVRFEEKFGNRPSSQYAFPGYVMIDVWAKAVERAGTTDSAAVVAELEQMDEEPTLFGPRTFTSELHHQNRARYHIVKVTDGKPEVVDSWTIEEPIPLEALLQ